MEKRFTGKILNPRQAEVRRQSGDSVEQAVSGDEGMYSAFKNVLSSAKSKVAGAMSKVLNIVFPPTEMSVRYRESDSIDIKLPPISDIVSLNLPAPKPLCFDSGTSVPTPGRFNFNDSDTSLDILKKTVSPHDYMNDLPPLTENDRVKLNTPVWKKHNFKVPERISKKNLPGDVQVESNPSFEIPQMALNSKNAEEIPLKSQKSEDFAKATKPVVQDPNSSSKKSLGGSSDKFKFEEKSNGEQKERLVRENPNSTPILSNKNLRRKEPSNSKSNIFSSPSTHQNSNAYLMTPEFKMTQGEIPKNIGFFVSENERQNPQFESEGFAEDDTDEIFSKKSETGSSPKASSDKKDTSLDSSKEILPKDQQKNEAPNFSNPFASMGNSIKLSENPFKIPDIAANATGNPLKNQDNAFKPVVNPFKNPDIAPKTLENSLKNQDNAIKPADNPFKNPEIAAKAVDFLKNQDNTIKPVDNPFKPQDSASKTLDNPLKPQGNLFKPQDSTSKLQDNIFKFGSSVNPPPKQSEPLSSTDPQSKLPSNTDTSPNNLLQKPNSEVKSSETSPNILAPSLPNTNIVKENLIVSNPQASNSLNFNTLISSTPPISQTSITILTEEEKLIKLQQEKIAEEQQKLAAISSVTDTNSNNPFLSVSNVQQAKPSYVFGSSSSAPPVAPTSISGVLSSNAFIPQGSSGASTNQNPFQPVPVANIPYNPFNNQTTFSSTPNNAITGNFPMTNSNQSIQPSPFPALNGAQQNPFSTNPANQSYNFTASTTPQNPFVPNSNPVNQPNPFNNSSFVPNDISSSNPFSASSVPPSNPFNANSTYQPAPFTGNTALNSNSFVQNPSPFNPNTTNNNPFSNQSDQNLHDVPMNSSLPYDSNFNSAFSSTNYNSSFQGQSSNNFMQTDTSSNFPRQGNSSISYVAQNPFGSGHNSSTLNLRPNAFGSNFGSSGTDLRVETNAMPSQVTGTFSMGSVPRSNSRARRFQ